MSPASFLKNRYIWSILVLCGVMVQNRVLSETASDGVPDFGPNVLIFDSSMPMATIQSNLNAVFARQERSQFGTNRYAFFFKPGSYDLDVNVGFYTQVLGLGENPDQVIIRGSVHSEADWMGGNATCTFWRSWENLSVIPTNDTPLTWAVSQGTSFRRTHVSGNVNLWDNGWSSGGFMADCKIDGRVNSGTQQQWFSRNDDYGSWTGANWNMTFVGIINPPSGTWPKPPYTVIEKTPVIREKAFLFLNKEGHYAVMVPELEASDTLGTSWGNRKTKSIPIPLEKFYLAHAGKDNAASINVALKEGRHLLFTPGIYHLESSIRLTRPDTIVLGLGFTTLVPDRGDSALAISDVDGVKIGGIMIDAGTQESPVLLEVGTQGSTLGHSKNPCFLYDVFIRVGGATVGTAAACLAIHSSDVVGDNLWIWRADHGAGASWDRNKSKNGLIVNGNNVTLYGLFVEHFQEYQTLWNGENGRVYFYQCELPYDAPSQSVWQHDGVNGYAAYKVADTVKNHEAWGLGVYGVFTRSSTKCFNAFETPASLATKMHHMISIWITGKANTETTHVINGTGNAVNSANKKVTVE